MPRTAAKFTQAEVARTIRAAKQIGAKSIDVKRSTDGTTTMTIDLIDVGSEAIPVAPDNEIIL
jgi:hypothetical protein